MEALQHLHAIKENLKDSIEDSIDSLAKDLHLKPENSSPPPPQLSPIADEAQLSKMKSAELDTALDSIFNSAVGISSTDIFGGDTAQPKAATPEKREIIDDYLDEIEEHYSEDVTYLPPAPRWKPTTEDEAVVKHIMTTKNQTAFLQAAPQSGNKSMSVAAMKAYERRMRLLQNRSQNTTQPSIHSSYPHSASVTSPTITHISKSDDTEKKQQSTYKTSLTLEDRSSTELVSELLDDIHVDSPILSSPKGIAVLCEEKEIDDDDLSTPSDFVRESNIDSHSANSGMMSDAAWRAYQRKLHGK